MKESSKYATVGSLLVGLRRRKLFLVETTAFTSKSNCCVDYAKIGGVLPRKVTHVGKKV